MLLADLLAAVSARPATVAVAVAAAAVLLYLVDVVLLPPLRAWPLRHIPGPAAARFTSAVLRWHELHGRRTRYIHALHQRYGPVVRLAPDEVSFATAGAVKAIYNTAGSGYDKTPFYDLFTVYGRRTMFSTLDKENHARRRRILADRYSNSNIVRGPAIHLIQERAERFLQLCDDAPDGVLDIYAPCPSPGPPPPPPPTDPPALHAYAFDCVTAHLFNPYGTDSMRIQWHTRLLREVTFDDSLQNRLIRFYSPKLYAVVSPLLALFTARRQTPLADNFVLDTAAKTNADFFTLLRRMNERLADAAAADAEAALPQAFRFDRRAAAAECSDHMVAGIDTTGDVLCFLMWELSQPRSRAFQDRLRAELRQAAGLSAQATVAAVENLPYLDAVVQEGLRCFPAIPMSLPRVVPSSSSSSSSSSPSSASVPGRRDGQTIDGIFLPAGTVVSCQAYSVHRIDTAVFPDPDTFCPDRWLDPAGAADRKRLSFAFSSGGRGCIGKHLALVEMKLLLRAVYTKFATTPDPATTPASMAMSDQLISSRPLGQSCLLRFHPLDENGALLTRVGTLVFRHKDFK